MFSLAQCNVRGLDSTSAAQTMKLVGDGVEEQAEQVMRNMEAILAAAGCTFDDIVKTTVLCASLLLCIEAG